MEFSKGLAFFALSLVGLEKRESYPLRIEQIIKSADESNINTTTPPTVKKRKRGRPKGSKNKDKSQYTLSSELFRLKGMLLALLSMIGNTIHQWNPESNIFESEIISGFAQ